MSSDSGGDAPLGPRPATPRRDPMTHLSVPRAYVLEKLGQFSQPTTVAELAAACEQHPNTVREHLDALIQAGLVTRTTAPARGRGRPAILYQAEPLDANRPQVREYAVLATALVQQIEATVEDAKAWGRAAGVRRGLGLVSPTEEGVRAAEAATREILARHHFDPVDAPDGTIRLRQCPLLDMARVYPDVVCSLHQGVLIGLYQAHGVGERAMRITPFALPGCCLIEFPPDPDAGPPVPPAPEPPRRVRLRRAASPGSNGSRGSNDPNGSDGSTGSDFPADPPPAP